MSKKNSNRVCVLFLFLSAFLLRIVSYYHWLTTPFTEYSHIKGLDMLTHMEFAKSFRMGEMEFSLHRFLVASLMWLTGDDFPVRAVVFCQYILGAFVPVLIFYISLHISGRKFLALLAGLFSGFYAPLLMYESFTLVESIFVLSAVIALLGVLRMNFYSSLRTFLGGILVMLPALIRFSGVFISIFLSLFVFFRLFSKFRRCRENLRIIIKSLVIYFCGILFVVAGVVAINHINYGKPVFFPGKPVLGYIFEAGAQFRINPVEEEKIFLDESGFAFQQRTANYVSKFFDLIRPFEIPDNLNYYFIRNQFVILLFLIGPLLLIPLAVSGFLLSLAHPRRLGRYFVFFLYFIALALPMVVFLPLARYRVALLPIFAFFASYYIIEVRRYLRISHERPLPLLLSLLCYLIVLTWSAPSTFPLRSEDFIAYGEGLERKRGDKEIILAAYLKAYEISPDSRSAVMHLANFLMVNSNFSDAKKILEDFMKKHPKDSGVRIMYASSLLGVGEYLKAKAELERMMPPEEGKQRVNYFYQLGEANRLIGEFAEAKKFYQEALDFSQTDEEKKIIQSAIENLSKFSAKEK